MFARAILDPGLDQPDRGYGRMRRGLGKILELREPFQVAPRGKNDLGVAPRGLGQHLVGTRPEQVDILRLVHRRFPCASAGDEESRVEVARFPKAWAPAREIGERLKIEPPSAPFQSKREIGPSRKRRTQRCCFLRIERGREGDRQSAFLKCFADRGNARRRIVRFKPEAARQPLGIDRDRVITGIDPSTRKNQRSGRERHPAGTLYDEQIRRRTRPVAEQDECCRGYGGGLGHPSRAIAIIAPWEGAWQHRAMGVVEILGVAASVSLLSGWRIYLCVFATGLAMRTGWIALPEHLAALDILANPWVIGVAAIGLVAEFLADKVAWLDSIWDGVHTLVRPVGGALLALAIIDPQDPAWQVVSFLLGGGAALLTHGAKAGARAVVNTSPEPFSNVAVSAGEDVATAGLLYLALANPVAAVVIAIVITVAAIAALILLRRLLKRLFARAPAEAER